VKVYKTIKVEDIEGYGQGWNIEKMFMQRVPEKVIAQDSYPPPPPNPNTGYSSSTYPMTVSVEKLVMAQRMFVLLSRDADIAAREQELQAQINKLGEATQDLKLSADQKDAKIKGLEDQVASATKYMNQANERETAASGQKSMAVASAADKQKQLDKLKTAIGELRYNDVLNAGSTVESENPFTARMQQIEPYEQR
jgi:vacuolar-type H+-ATPase subunit I/STV1